MEEHRYNLQRIATVVVAVTTAMITAAMGLADLGLTPQQRAVLVVVVTGLQALAVFLPAAQHRAGTVRGSTRDRSSHAR